MSERITVVLTARPPVEIDPVEWPTIAKAEEDDFDGQYEFQSFRITNRFIKVRRHADGRTLVYATHVQKACYGGADMKRGVLLDPDVDPVPSILAIAKEMYEGAEQNGEPWHRLGHECVANLPAEVL